MSGIAGVIDWAGNFTSNLSEILMNIMAAVAHRGNSPKHTWLSSPVAFGCHPFYPTPCKTITLPLISSCGRYVIVADIRLDNRTDLMNKLELNIEDETLYSDSALVLIAYQRWQENCLSSLLGDFALAIWDDIRKQIFCAVDPMGTKPFFYVNQTQGFYFASEIKSLLRAPNVEKRLNEAAFIRQVGVIHPLMAVDEQTVFEGINQLLGGHYLIITSKTFTSQLYWKIERPAPRHYADEEECLHDFRTIFREAIRCRLRGASSVATQLSGGLDSSSIACEAITQARAAGLPFRAFASALPADYTGDAVDEKIFIQAVEKKYNFKTHYVSAGKGPLENLAEAFDITTTPIIPDPNLCKALADAAQHHGHTIVLSGLLGELGPTSHAKGYLYRLFLAGHWKKAHQEIALHAKYQGVSQYSVLKGHVLSLLVKNALNLAHYSQENDYQFSLIAPVLSEKYNLPAQEKKYIQSLVPHHPDYFINFANQCRRPFEQSSSTSGCRIYYPYMDIRLIEFCLSLDESWYFRKGWKRYLIRASMEGILPKTVQWRTDKKPFYPDYYAQLASQSSHYLAQLAVMKKSSSISNYIKLSNIEQAINALNAQRSWRPEKKKTDSARLIVDFGMQAASFLQWFEELK